MRVSRVLSGPVELIYRIPCTEKNKDDIIHKSESLKKSDDHIHTLTNKEKPQILQKILITQRH